MHFVNILVSLVLNLRSPQLLDRGSQTIGRGVEVDKTEHSEERNDQVEDLESLAHMLRVIPHESTYRSAVIAPDVAHTNAAVHGVQHAEDVVNRDLHVNVLRQTLRRWQKEQERKKRGAGPQQ